MERDGSLIGMDERRTDNLQHEGRSKIEGTGGGIGSGRT